MPEIKNKKVKLTDDGIEVDVEIHPPDGSIKKPQSSLKKKTKLEKKKPKPKAPPIPSLWKPLPSAIIVCEQPEQAKITHYNSTHGLKRIQSKLRICPSKKHRYILGYRAAMRPLPDTVRDPKALRLFDR